MAKRILVVEDEPDMVAIMKLTLENKGYEIISAYDGEEGLFKARETLPDLVILDILIPKILGDDLATLLRRGEETRNIPIIFFSNLPVTSSYSSKTGSKQFQFDSQGNIYLHKTCNEEELVSAIEYMLNKK